MSVGPRDTSPLSVHARWPGVRGRILQNKIRETNVRKTGHILPWFGKQPDDGAVPLLQRHERNIRFQLAAVDEYKALIVEHGIKLGSRNEAVALPNTLADICGREVRVSVILNWPERIKTQPHDDRDNCFLPFDSKGPLRYDSEQ